MKLLSEFKEFAMKGNVIDLAVGVVIGGAFGKLVEGVVKGIIEPVVALIRQEGDGQQLLNGLMSLGSGVLNFLLLAAVVFFVFVKPINKLRAMTTKPKEPEAPVVPEDVKLLAEIRDLLKKQSA